MPAADCMSGSVQGIFHVAKNSIEPLKLFAIVVFSPDRRDNRLMQALVTCKSGKTIQATRDNVAFRSEVFALDPFFDLSVL
jgi:hypothetical protein